MNPVALAVCGIGAIALFVCVWVLLAPSSTSGMLQRINDAYDEDDNEPEIIKVKQAPAEALRASLQQSFGKKLDKSDRGSKLADGLVRADLKLKPAEWLLIAAGVSFLTGVLVMLRFGSPIMFLVGAAAGWFGANFFLKRRQGKRRKAFDKQLPTMILAISNGIKAGYTFAQAIDLVSKNSGPPMGAELSRITREVQLGVPLVEALAKMVKRNDSEDMRLMLTAVQIQMQVGGNLAQILDSIEYTIRERIRIKGEIKTITSQARASGWVLMILPFALAGILSVIAPSYFTPMFSNFVGQVMLGIGGFSLLCGYGLIRKIVNVQV